MVLRKLRKLARFRPPEYNDLQRYSSNSREGPVRAYLRNFRTICSAPLALTLFLMFVCTWVRAREKPPTAREIVAAIQEHVGIPWMKETVDTFKAGNPDTPVTGIAVTMMATLDVLQRAAANHENLVITHEPTFYSHQDVPEGMDASDPVWAAKRAFIEKNGLVVWRFHDHWHRRNPDGILAGMVHALGWERYQQADDPKVFTLPQTTVAKLAAEVAKRLGSPVLRVVGDPEMKITKVALTPGFSGFVRETHALEQDNVEVLLAGETREWETVEYAADAVTEGKRKALIIIGHIPSEQAGMEECVRWLKTFVTGVPIEFVPAKQPFWLPEQRAER
jgi:putative NIF3 family GTP cyclohydrolase 1 type 2